MPERILNSPGPLFLPGVFSAPGKPVLTFGVELEVLGPNLSGQPGPYIDHEASYTVYSDLIRQNTGLICLNRTHPDYKFTSSCYHPKTFDNWFIKHDTTVRRDHPSQIVIEIISPILSGRMGLEQIDSVFHYLHSIGLKTNKTCGLHVHISCGWDRPISKETLTQCVNIYRAIKNNHVFFDGLYAPERLSNIHCQRLEFIDKPELLLQPGNRRSSSEVLAELNGSAGEYNMYNFNLPEHGTLEFKGKEADNFHNALGYIGFVAAFTYEAANNPYITADEVIDKYFVNQTPALAPNRNRLIYVPGTRETASIVPAFQLT